MPRISVLGVNEGNFSYIENTSKYVAREDKCLDGYIGATNVYLPNNRKKIAGSIVSQMMNVREFHSQMDSRLGIHVIFAFSPDECKYITKADLLSIGYHIAETEFSDCITYFAVHDHTDNLHIDMLIDTVKITDGKMYGCNLAGWRAVGNHLIQTLEEYIPKDKISPVQVSFSVNH